MLSLSVVSDSLRLWTVAPLASLSIGFFRQESWSGLPFPPPRDLPNSGTELASPVYPALAEGFFTTESPEAHVTGREHPKMKTPVSMQEATHESAPHLS